MLVRVSVCVQARSEPAETHGGENALQMNPHIGHCISIETVTFPLLLWFMTADDRSRLHKLNQEENPGGFRVRRDILDAAVIGLRFLIDLLRLPLNYNCRNKTKKMV